MLKDIFNPVRVTASVGGKDFVFETGRVANQADGAVWVQCGGTVVLAAYNGGYGNCVMIDHGGGVVTLYGHMQSYAVGYGQSVSAGQTIGYVGSTGVVTGPHLHFEIRINGAQTDPAAYFSGLTYWNC